MVQGILLANCWSFQPKGSSGSSHPYQRTVGIFVIVVSAKRVDVCDSGFENFCNSDFSQKAGDLRIFVMVVWLKWVGH